MKCLKCAIKTNVIELKTERWHKCINCVNGIEKRKCEDCGGILVYCKITKYGHDGETPRNCMWFKPKTTTITIRRCSKCHSMNEIDYDKCVVCGGKWEFIKKYKEV